MSRSDRWLVADMYADKTLKPKINDFLYEQESYKIRGACFEVWKQFKGMFKESIIDNALTIALQAKGLAVESQKRINIYFQDKKVGTYIPDKIINGIILIELKSKALVTKHDLETFWNYLKGSEYKLGFFINFSPTKLEIKRVVYDTAREKTHQR